MSNPLKKLFKPILSIFSSSALRILLNLLLLVTCYTCMAIALLTSIPPVVGIPLVVLNATIFLHHWYVMSKRDVLKDGPRCGAFIDFILTAAECTLVLFWLRPWNLRFSPYQRSAFITLIAAIYVQVVCLSLLLVIRFVVIVAQAFHKPLGLVTNPFDFYALTKDGDKPGFFTQPSGVAFSHDQHWFVFLLRRFFTIIIALALLAYAFTNLVLEPVQETGMTPQKTYTTAVFSETIPDGNWSVVAFARNNTFGDASNLQKAVQVSALWDNTSVAWGTNGTATIDAFCPIRNFEGPENDIAIFYMNQVNVKMVVFDCPFGDVVPDLLVTVNFTELGINATFPANAQYGTVSIVLGLHTDILDVLHNTWAIPLTPDMHLFGGVIRIIREQFKRPGLASLGVFSSMKTFYTCAIPFLSPDPSPQTPRDNNTASLRVYLTDDYSDWHISAEYREKSVLGGISAVGGFWTVLNGLFGTIFGTTLMFVLFGTKPLSTFGLIHKIPKFRPVLEDDPDGRYRNLLSEGQSDQGMLDYVRDHFVNLSPFEDHRALNEKPKPGTSSPDLTSNKMNE